MCTYTILLCDTLCGYSVVIQDSFEVKITKYVHKLLVGFVINTHLDEKITLCRYCGTVQPRLSGLVGTEQNCSDKLQSG